MKGKACSMHPRSCAGIALLAAVAACGGTTRLQDRAGADAERDVGTEEDVSTGEDAGTGEDASMGQDASPGQDAIEEQDAATDRAPGRCVWEQLIVGFDVPPISLLVPDPTNDRLVIVGPSGTTGAVLLGTTPRAMELPAMGEPPPADLDGATIVFDRRRRRVLLYGGRSVSLGIVQSRVFAMTLDSAPVWSVVATSGDAPTRTAHGAAIDEQGQRMFVFGGFRDNVGPQYADTFVLSLDGTPTWSGVPDTEPKPEGRYNPRVTWDAKNGRLLVRGGSAPLTRDMWALTPDPAPAWAELVADPPLPEIEAGGGWGADPYDPIGSAWLVVGVHYPRPPDPPLPLPKLDVYRMPLIEPKAGFSRIATENAPFPSSVDQNHPASYDDSSDRLYVGFNWRTGGRANEIWTLPLSECR